MVQNYLPLTLPMLWAAQASHICYLPCPTPSQSWAAQMQLWEEGVHWHMSCQQFKHSCYNCLSPLSSQHPTTQRDPITWDSSPLRAVPASGVPLPHTWDPHCLRLFAGLCPVSPMELLCRPSRAKAFPRLQPESCSLIAHSAHTGRAPTVHQARGGRGGEEDLGLCLCP